jgi:FtsH-binding integral membrane protein
VNTARVAAIVVVWFLLAAAFAAQGLLMSLQPPAPQAMIAGLAFVAWLATRRIGWLRTWSDTVDPRALVLPHLFRAVAAAGFLQAVSRRELPAGFGLPAAWGDFAVAALAALLLSAGAIRTRHHARAWQLWNVLGLIDLVLVVANAARFWVAHPAAMSPMLRLPLALLPSFLVPIVFVTHALLIGRLSAVARTSSR